MRDIDELFAALGRSKFRSRFRLSGKEAQYFRDKGMATILQHARDFVMKRLGDAEPANDGKQTPTRKHPVFVAQHATGTCCRDRLHRRGSETLAGRAGRSAASSLMGMTLLNIVRKKPLHSAAGPIYWIFIRLIKFSTKKFCERLRQWIRCREGTPNLK